MEVIDTQSHLNRLGPNWRDRDIETALATAIVAMDAVGVDAVIIDERWGAEIRVDDRHMIRLSDGSRRFEYPLSELAVAAFPNRFAFVGRVDRTDPEFEVVMADLRTRAGCVGLRIDPSPIIGELQPFIDGAYDAYFAAAQRLEMPVFVRMSGDVELLIPVLEKFPDLQLVLDHSGSVSPAPSTWEARMRNLDRVLAMASHTNLALKWCKAPTRISMDPYPHRDLWPVLRRVIDAFGADRVMWAADASQTVPGHSWSDSLHSVLQVDSIDETEKGWLLGGTARTFLNWTSETGSGHAGQ
jgi:L-fuconolactonase